MRKPHPITNIHRIKNPHPINNPDLIRKPDRANTLMVIFGLAACSVIGIRATAQNSAATSMPLTDLKSLNSPCFQLLDIAPASVTHSATPKEFGLSALSQLKSGGGALPTNFAFEMAPYWYFKPKGENVYKYLNVDTNKRGAYYFTGIPRKLGISIASSSSDSNLGSLRANTNYISFGIRTNLLTIRSNRNIDSIRQHLNSLRARQFLFTAFGVSANDLAKGVLADKEDSTNLQIDLNQIPLFQLDGAFAYSEAFESNSINHSRFNRTAGWLTATLGIPLGRKYNNNLSVLGLFKLLSDNLLTDTAKFVFRQRSATDIGGKISYSNNNFLIGLEFVQRNYAGASALNSHRCVGVLQYAINSSLYLTASFGQNFGEVNNLFSAIGLNFGFGNSRTSLPD